MLVHEVLSIQESKRNMKNSSPKYIEISKAIIAKIEAGELLPGDKVPSENELINMYKISNTTARKSLLEVELQGWANRIKGKTSYPYIGFFPCYQRKF